MNTKHAGTPFDLDCSLHDETYFIYDMQRECVAEAMDYESGKFIVLACNAHDDLVAALKDAMRLLIVAGYALEGTATGRMKSALAKAGEE